MENKLYDMMNGRYDNVSMKNILAGMFINLDTDSMVRSFVEQKTNKDSVSLKELERKYVKGSYNNRNCK